MKKETKIWLLVVAIAVALVVVAWFAGMYRGQKMVEESLESKTDTVVKITTVYKEFPEPLKTVQANYLAIPSYRFLSDTVTNEVAVFLHDTTVV